MFQECIVGALFELHHERHNTISQRNHVTCSTIVALTATICFLVRSYYEITQIVVKVATKTLTSSCYTQDCVSKLPTGVKTPSTEINAAAKFFSSMRTFCFLFFFENQLFRCSFEREERS